jgi:hypothetical protein
MSSLDEEVQEPFKLCVDSIQGKWLCEELGVSLRVSGCTVQYASGECYPLEVTPEGKLEIFGYRGLEKKSDASTVIWKHKETGHNLTWMYEGDADEQEPEVDASLIIQNSSGGRTTRKRKVDYVALDKKLDSKDMGLTSSKQTTWQNLHGSLKDQQSASSSGPTESDITDSFMELKSNFEIWLKGTNTQRFQEILAKRGYLSTELKSERTSKGIAASIRLVNYLKSLGAKAWESQEGTGINVRVPEVLWKQFVGTIDLSDANKHSTSPKSQKSPDLTYRVNRIKEAVTKFLENADTSSVNCSEIENALAELESLPIDLDTLKETRIGVEINKLSKTNDRAKMTLEKLKSVYLASKKD